MKDDNKDKPAGNIPKEDPSKAMDSKKEVEQSPDEKTDQDFPGYPHYPAKEDIMDQRTDAHRVDVDVENLPSSRNASGVSQRFIVSDDREYLKEDTVSQTGMEDDFQDIGPRTVVDEKDKKLANTGSTNAEIGVPQNVDNDDLADDRDLPGTDLDEEDGITNASNDADVTP
ncbi:MAG: hypothetical protein ICV81_10660 [Flavisolibacter sp.]|nr:hypothetical protein [Flavisolibacter sp.]